MQPVTDVTRRVKRPNMALAASPLHIIYPPPRLLPHAGGGRALGEEGGYALLGADQLALAPAQKAHTVRSRLALIGQAGRCGRGRGPGWRHRCSVVLQPRSASSALAWPGRCAAQQAWPGPGAEVELRWRERELVVRGQGRGSCRGEGQGGLEKEPKPTPYPSPSPALALALALARALARVPSLYRAA